MLPLITVACQPGMYWSSGTETCVNCTVNQYQDMEAMTSCKLCPALTYNDDEGSNSLNACKCKSVGPLGCIKAKTKK